MEEIWKSIKDSSNFYFVSSLGRVKSCGIDRRGHKKKERILKLKDDGHGYSHVGLLIYGKFKSFKVHVLVADAFIGERPKGYQIDHINGNRKDNRVSNLRIVTRYDNYKNPSTYDKHPFKERPVAQYSLQGELIREFKSLHEAARLIGGSPSNICLACKGIYKKSKGYKWKFI